MKAKLGRLDGASYWEPLRQTLSSAPGIVGRLDQIREDTHLGPEITLLRVLGVTIWTA